MNAVEDRGSGRLIELIDFDRPVGGSFVPMVRSLLAEARGRGWATEAVLPPSAADVPWVDDLRSDGVDVHVMPFASGDTKMGEWFGELIDRGSTRAVLHSHFHGFDVAAWKAARKRPEVAFVLHVHSVYSRHPAQVIRALLKFSAMRHRFDAILCPAENVCESTIRRGAPRSKVHFEASAIDTTKFPLASAEERAEAKRSLGLDPDKPAVGHFGWHWYLKGGDVFLESIRALVDSGQTNIVAVERGGDEQYLRYAEKIGIADRLVVLPPADAVWTLHAAMDVLVCSSRKEGMAYATLEALATGTPVVATDIPGHAFLADHIDACRLTGHEPAEIAAATAETLERGSDAAEREAIQGREWIEANLDIRSAATRVIDRFSDLAASRATTPNEGRPSTSSRS